MSEPQFTANDLEEIFYALELKAHEVERGRYDDYPGEVGHSRSQTRRWAAHLRRIMKKIEGRTSRNKPLRP